MSTPTEQRLRDLLAAEADVAPRAAGLAEGALRKVRRRRRIQLACAGGVAGLVVVATGVSVIDAAGRPPDSPVAASVEATGQGAPPSATPAPGRGAASLGGDAASCVERYSPAAVAGRGFAFDGTVTSIGPARSDRPGAELELAGVTFRVHAWFRGGSGDSVTVDMPPSEIGTRLLVSGEPRWGGGPLDAAIAWSCGFTRPYDARTAAEWAAATD